jgi:site-specific DNA recombinase
MQPEAYKAFVDEFTKEYNIRASQEEITRKNLNLELEKIQTEQNKLIEAIKAGIPGEMVKDEMLALKERRSAITEKLKATLAPVPRLHPNLSLIYKNKVANLIDALNNDDTITEANEAIRQLIETIRLVPFKSRLKIELYAELAALLNLGLAPKNDPPLDNSKRVQVAVVAGARFVQDPTIKKWV